MTDERIGGKPFINVVIFAFLIAIASAVAASSLSIYVDWRLANGVGAPLTSESVDHLWKVVFSSISFVFGLVGGKVV